MAKCDDLPINSVSFSVSLPSYMVEILDEIAQRNFKDRSKYIQDAIREKIHRDVVSSAPDNQNDFSFWRRLYKRFFEESCQEL